MLKTVINLKFIDFIKLLGKASFFYLVSSHRGAREIGKISFFQSHLF